jgi:hypothetical protein
MASVDQTQDKTALLRLPSSYSNQRTSGYSHTRAGGLKTCYRNRSFRILQDASAWSCALTLWEHRGPSFLTNPILIGDGTTMHLFWIDYRSNQIFRSNMLIDHFPSTFTYLQFVSLEFQETLQLGCVQVYTVKDMNQYLMVVEVEGSIEHFY